MNYAGLVPSLGAVTIKNRRLLAIVVMTSLMTDFCAAQTASPILSGATPVAKLDQELQAVLDDPVKPLASLSTLAIRNGRVVYQGHFGKRVIDGVNPERSQPINGRTLYRVASISKLVTAIGAMQLVEQKKLDLDADISQYLGFKVRNPNFPDAVISARMLLSHTSSLRDAGGYSFPIDWSLQSVLDPQGENYGAGQQWAQASAVSDRAPGKYFDYVNLNWGVLGTVMEAVSGQRFDRYMKKAVLEPLQIPGNFNAEELSLDEIRHLAVLYRKRSNEVWSSSGPWVAQADDYQDRLPAPRAGLERYRSGRNATPFSPQGGLRISATGLSKLMLALINGGELDGVRLLEQASVQQMLHEEWRHDSGKANGDNYKGLFNAWGLGAQKFLDLGAPGRGDRLRVVGGLTGFGHAGFAYGLQSLFFFDPVKRDGMIYIIGGVGFDPELDSGQYSSRNSWEEKVLDVLYYLAIAKQP
jgi:CubicO group peptidase (beta-lactamase class C family)